MLVYHTVNGVHALFHTSKTAKIIKVILLRTPSQNVNVLLSNITFIIFAVFGTIARRDRMHSHAHAPESGAWAWECMRSRLAIVPYEHYQLSQAAR